MLVENVGSTQLRRQTAVKEYLIKKPQMYFACEERAQYVYDKMMMEAEYFINFSKLFEIWKVFLSIFSGQS